MKYYKIQFNKLIIKNIVLAFMLFFICLGANAQDKIDSLELQEKYERAKVYYRQNEIGKSKEYFTAILTEKKKLDKDVSPNYFKVYNWLGLINKKQGNLSQAIVSFNLALENTSDNFYQTYINNNISIVYSMLGDYSNAITYLQNTLNILEKNYYESGIIDIVDNLQNQAYAYLKSGQLKLALQQNLKSLSIAKENNIKIRGSNFYNCGLIYQKLDSLEKADKYFKKAVSTYIKEPGANHYMTAMAYINHAVFYTETGNYEKSEKLLQKSYHILVKELGFKHYYTFLCLKNMGDLFYQKQAYSKALHYYQQALRAKIENFKDSSMYSNPHKDLYPDLDMVSLLNAKASTLQKLATTENTELNLKAALHTLELNVHFIEKLRTGYLYESSKLQLAAKEHKSYIALVDIAFELYQITQNKAFAETAFKHAELSKYGVLRELESEEMAKKTAGIPVNLQILEHGLKEQLNSTGIQLENENKAQNPDKELIEEYNRELFRLSQKLDSFKSKLEKDYPAYYKQKYLTHIANSTEIQQSIEHKEAILEYVLTGSSLYTFVITQKDFVFDKQDLDTVFFNSLDFYIQFLRSESFMNYNQYRKSAYCLYQFLIHPFEKEIKGKNLLIIPDDKLSFIPFESLVDEPYTNSVYADYSKEPYLIYKYPMGYSLSATLGIYKKQTGKNNHFLAFAPDYTHSKDSIPALPFSSKSLRLMNLLLKSKTYSGNNATENSFKKSYQDYGIIHFYTHGIEDSLNSSISKMYFSQGNDSVDDGYLHAYEVNNLKINAKLVFLASCFSGSGTLARGEGIMSMARSFIHAGSSSVVLSLWIAYYKPTIFIVKEFYKQMLLGKRKDEALRLAKIKYLKNSNPLTANPKYWASLTCIGNQEELFTGYIFKLTIGLFAGIFFVSYILFRLRRKIKSKNKV